nr:phosphoribosylformylglycinamidine synthase subunit PurQ [Denitromonas sp.]
RARLTEPLRAAGLSYHFIGEPNNKDEIRVWRNAKLLFQAPRIELQQTWTETSYQIARLRDDATCAQEEYDALADATDPGLSVRLSFDANEDIAAPMITTGVRPKIAILREQGVNSHVEMAAAFARAGFDPFDVHMSDLQNGRFALADFKGVAACGGFSYGDVLGAGQGWAKSILFNAKLRDAFEAFFGRDDTFALGVCNGCQMMSHLAPIIPGAQHWPTFHRNRSEQFEARFSQVEILDNPSIFFDGMAGSRMPIVVSHGEGQAVFTGGAKDSVIQAVRFIDHHGQAAERYPFNPNGSPEGITGVTTDDGRFTIMMPHPERTHRTTQMSWYPAGSGEDSPWMRMFRNARRWVG